jgi:hypothetical protein
VAGGAGAPTSSGAGIAASSLTCDTFPVPVVQAAVQQQVPGVIARRTPTASGDSTDGMSCEYDIAAARTDLSSADRGLAQVTLTIADVWSDTPITGSDDDVHEKEGYESERHSVQSAANGPAENNATGMYHDVTGVGTAAYLVDTVHTDDAGTPTQYSVNLCVLHDPRPYNVQLDLNYVIPQPDQPLPDKALDTVLRVQSGRARLAQKIAAALLAKVP